MTYGIVIAILILALLATLVAVVFDQVQAAPEPAEPHDAEPEYPNEIRSASTPLVAPAVEPAVPFGAPGGTVASAIYIEETIIERIEQQEREDPHTNEPRSTESPEDPDRDPGALRL